MKDNELITRKNIELALLNKGQHSRRYKLGEIWELDYYEIRQVLDDVEADVLVHGEWISIFDQDESKCSECGKQYYYPIIRGYKYCPNCGAKMDIGCERNQ